MAPAHLCFYALVDSPHAAWKVATIRRALLERTGTAVEVVAEWCFHVVLEVSCTSSINLSSDLFGKTFCPTKEAVFLSAVEIIWKSDHSGRRGPGGVRELRAGETAVAVVAESF